MDFGAEETTGQAETWNNFSSTEIGTISSDLLDITGASTSIELSITNAFHGSNNTGTTDASAPYTSNATRDSFYDANSNWGDGTGDITGVLEFAGLDVNKTYSFTFYASRTGVGDNRSTVYTVEGENLGAVVLNVANNVVDTVTVSEIQPNAGGVITLTVTPDAANTNGNQFIYLGVIEMNATTVVPEPSTAGLIIPVCVAGASLFVRRRRR